MRLIDADALKEWVEEYHTSNWGIPQDELIYAIGSAPTIDPVKHGEWLLHEYPDGYYHTECSECGAVYDEMVFFSKKAHYCPNCGAKNGGEDDCG